MNHIRIIITILILFNYTFAFSSSDIKNREEILFISSYSSEGTYVQTNISSFIDTYIHLKGRYKPVVETIGCTTLDDSNNWVNKTKHILKKHENAKLVILMGTEAWISYLSLDDKKYKEIPSFFIMGQRYCANMKSDSIKSIQLSPHAKNINYNNYKYSVVDILTKMKDFNVKLCYYYDYDIDSDIQLINNLFPKTKNIAIINDNTYNGISHKRRVFNYIKKKYPQYSVTAINGRNYNIDTSLQKFKSLPNNSVAILCIWRYDKDGVLYMNNAQYAFKEANNKIPVFSLTGTGIGNWAIGGCIPKYRLLGEELAQYAYNIIDKKRNLTPIMNGYDNQYKIDLNVLNKYHLIGSSLPKETIYINAELTWKELLIMYKWYFILSFIIIIILSISIISLLYYSMHIRKLKNNIIKIDQELRKERDSLVKSQKELIIAKEEAEEANKMKDTFISNMSHEIRTPLNAIVGFSDVLVSSLENNKKQDYILEIIKQNTDILLKLVNDILYISKMEANRMEFNYEKQDIIPYLESSIASFSPNVKKEIDLKFICKEKEVIINTDIFRLQQIINNLLSNAIKNTEKGFISLSLEINKDKNLIIFFVTDTGRGIPLEEQKLVFDRFKKLNEFIQGTGLGLSICKITVEKMGGKIWIDKSYTDGARFCFSLPIEKDIEKNSYI